MLPNKSGARALSSLQHPRFQRAGRSRSEGKEEQCLRIRLNDPDPFSDDGSESGAFAGFLFFSAPDSGWEDDHPSDADEFAAEGSRLEDDEELRLHVTGHQTFFSTSRAEMTLRTVLLKIAGMWRHPLQRGWGPCPPGFFRLEASSFYGMSSPRGFRGLRTLAQSILLCACLYKVRDLLEALQRGLGQGLAVPTAEHPRVL